MTLLSLNLIHFNFLYLYDYNINSRFNSFSSAPTHINIVAQLTILEAEVSARIITIATVISEVLLFWRILRAGSDLCKTHGRCLCGAIVPPPPTIQIYAWNLKSCQASAIKFNDAPLSAAPTRRTDGAGRPRPTTTWLVRRRRDYPWLTSALRLERVQNDIQVCRSTILIGCVKCGQRGLGMKHPKMLYWRHLWIVP